MSRGRIVFSKFYITQFCTIVIESCAQRKFAGRDTVGNGGSTDGIFDSWHGYIYIIVWFGNKDRERTKRKQQIGGIAKTKLYDGVLVTSSFGIKPLGAVYQKKGTIWSGETGCLSILAYVSCLVIALQG